MKVFVIIEKEETYYTTEFNILKVIKHRRKALDYVEEMKQKNQYKKYEYVEIEYDETPKLYQL
jgi:hypothetical protein